MSTGEFPQQRSDEPLPKMRGGVKTELHSSHKDFELNPDSNGVVAEIIMGGVSVEDEAETCRFQVVDVSTTQGKEYLGINPQAGHGLNPAVELLLVQPDSFDLAAEKGFQWLRPAKPVEVGRDASTDSRFDVTGDFVSRSHASITQVVGRKLRVRDTSTNGTEVTVPDELDGGWVDGAEAAQLAKDLKPRLQRLGGAALRTE